MRFARRVAAAIGCLLVPLLAASADEPAAESTYVKLLKKAPEGRMGAILDVIAQRGSADDLAYLYHRATEPGSGRFPPTIRRRALEVVAEAARLRDLRPASTDYGRLTPLLQPDGPNIDPAARLAAVRLVEVGRAGGLVGDLARLAGSAGVDAPTRSAAFAALTAIGGDPARGAIRNLAEGPTPAVRCGAIAALVGFDLGFAADRAAGALTADARAEDVTPMVAAFLDRAGGADALAAALDRHKPSTDGARLGLRAVYALGRADANLVATLSRSAGLDAELVVPPGPAMDALVAEVAAKGDIRRGEAVFRRAELNCTNCHALVGAGGGVGPELTALGLSSPVDYVVNSILLPDQAIKEEFVTRLVVTDDGRTLQGIVVEEDDRRIVLKDATGERRVIPAKAIEESKPGGSLMPKGLANLMTHAEFVDLVRFLSELGKPGPLAIRSIPTIQRWRALDAPADDLDDATNAPADRWTPAYSEVGGDLPTLGLAPKAGPGPLFLRGEVQVSSPGLIAVRVNDSAGLTAWLDDGPVGLGSGDTVEAAEGRRTVTIRVDRGARGPTPVRVEVVKPEGSAAEFAVVGGR